MKLVYWFAVIVFFATMVLSYVAPLEPPIPAIGTAAFVLVLVLGSWFAAQKRPPGNCERCGYDVRASHGRCPECGAPTK